MTRLALLPGQRTDMLGHITEALAAVSRAMQIAPGAGPALVAGYAALSALARFRDSVEETSEITREER